MDRLSVPVSQPLLAKGELLIPFNTALISCSQVGRIEGAGVGILWLWPSCHLMLRRGKWLCSWLPGTPVLDLLLCPLKVEIISGWESSLGLTQLSHSTSFLSSLPRSSLSGRLAFSLLFGSILSSTPFSVLILVPDPIYPSASRAPRVPTVVGNSERRKTWPGRGLGPGSWLSFGLGLIVQPTWKSAHVCTTRPG